MAKPKAPKINYTLPGEPISQREMLKMLRQAEKGPFISMQALKNKIDSWKKNLANG